MEGAKTIATPLLTSVELQLANGSPSVDSTEFHRVINALQYFSYTRPNISFIIVNKLPQFMHSSSSTHWQVTKRLLRYLKNIVRHGILLCRSSPIHLHAFLDANWAINPNDRTSITAYLIFFGSNLIS